MSDAQTIAIMGMILYASYTGRTPEECLSTAKQFMDMVLSGEEGDG